MFALDLQRFFARTSRSRRQGGRLPCQSGTLALALALALCGLLAGGAAQAQAAAENAAGTSASMRPSAGTTSTITQAGPGEPVIQRNVIEDDASRIEETRIRGHIRRITVSPKSNSKLSYEIMLGDGSGSEASRGSAGKRVWNVLYF
jgi:hypothetical protein